VIRVIGWTEVAKVIQQWIERKGEVVGLLERLAVLEFAKEDVRRLQREIEGSTQKIEPELEEWIQKMNQWINSSTGYHMERHLLEGFEWKNEQN
jgi:hypothetical protein